MKVLISLVGRFHAFDLAYQMQKKGLLLKIITTNPKFHVKKWGIDSKNIISSPILELINRLKSYIPFISNQTLSLFIKRLNTVRVERHLKSANILVAWSGSSLEAIIKAKKMGIKVVLERGSTHHSFQMKILQEEGDICGFTFTPDYYIWERDLLEYELADYISIPSNFVKRTFIEYGIPEKKILVNPYGVDLSSFKKIKKEDDIFRVIFCGQISYQKGVQYLLQAFVELDLKDSELWLIGSINEAMRPVIQKFNSENIYLKGVYPQSELYKLYSQGSVFVMPSIQEGLAMVQLQAMACELPLICTTNTGGDDLITDGVEGFVIPIRDVEILKDKILYLYQNQETAKSMGKNAKKKVSNGFTWEDYGNRTEQNYKRVLSESVQSNNSAN